MDQLTQLINLLDSLVKEIKRSNDLKEKSLGYTPLDSMEKDTLTTIEAAEFLGISRDTVYRMVRTNELPHVKVRQKIFLRRSSLLKWMEEQEKQEEI